MKKLIFGEPICNKIECTHNDPTYPNNCRIISDVDTCCMADVQHPHHIQRIFAWIDKNWLPIALLLAVLAVFMFLGLYSYGRISSFYIEELRKEKIKYSRALEMKTNTNAWKRLWIRHGRPAAVIYELGKTPYYTNKEGRKCRFT